MKAAVLNKLHTPLNLVERPDLSPKPGHVVVRLKTAALNRRDYWITQGMYPSIQLPVVLGSDGAGIVREVGSEVDPVWLNRDVMLYPGMDWGDQEAAQSKHFHVFGMPSDGTFATEVLIPVETLFPKPEELSWEEAAALPLAGLTAWRAIFQQGDLQSNDRVWITGIGGGVALFALQFAVAAGAEVWVTSSSDDKIEQAKSLGAAGGFNYRSNASWSAFTSKAGQPRLIIDGAGGNEYGHLVQSIAPGGCIVNYGSTAGNPDQVNLFKIFWKQIRIQGSTMGSPADFRKMLDFVATQNIKPIIDQTFKLEEVNEALKLMQHSGQFGKIALRCGA